MIKMKLQKLILIRTQIKHKLTTQQKRDSQVNLLL